MKTIDIVLPVYNEEEGIAAFHEALQSALHPLALEYRFHPIYVLDRSRDNTLAVLKTLAGDFPNITVIHLSSRFGHQMSLVAGIDNSRGDAIIMMDCDQQHPPSVIPQMLRKFEEGYDVVNTVRKYDRQTHVLKTWTSRLFYRIQNALSPVELQEGGADFRLISSKVAKVFQGSIREQNQFLRGLFQWVGFRSTTVVFVSPPRPAGRTKYSAARLLALATAGIISFSKVPLRLAALLGFVISFLSLCYGTWLLVEYFYAGEFPKGYTSLILVVLFMGGLQLSVLGIVGEYLGSVFDEVKNRPLYVIDEIIHGDLS
jgi:glycosyltransferase involved in cell wall biosynthesis